MKKKRKVVLAYSGGLDTSIILKWLQENYNVEVITYTADIGQKINKNKIIDNAKKYEGIYLLGTSIARPLIAKRQIAIAKKLKAFAVSHGATDKGNDQVRFELCYYYFGPKIKIIAPWREWKFSSRTDLINYAKKKEILIPKDKKGAPPFSVDDNLFHTSTEGKMLEDPNKNPPEYLFQRTTSLEKTPSKTTRVKIGFKNGDPISINKKKYTPSKLLEKLNNLAGKNGVGRVDLVENRFIGIERF